MSLDKAIKHGKEHRKPYRGSKRFDGSCRNHGLCGWCISNRAHKNKKRIAAMNTQMKEATIPETIDQYIKDRFKKHGTIVDKSKATIPESHSGVALKKKDMKLLESWWCKI